MTGSGDGSLLQLGAELAVLHPAPGRKLLIASQINTAIVSNFFSCCQAPMANTVLLTSFDTVPLHSPKLPIRQSKEMKRDPEQRHRFALSSLAH